MKNKLFCRSLLILSFLASGSFAIAEETARPLMQRFQDHFEALKPLMTSEVEFNSKKNQLVIAEHLKDLTKLVKDAKHVSELKSPSLSVSRKVLEGHIEETERVFRVGNKSYARWMLNSTLFACMGCHAQTPKGNSIPWAKKSFEGLNARAQFSEAEFLFATRRFEEALPGYDRIISGFPKNNLRSDELEASMKRKVAYFAQFKGSPAEGAASLQESLKNKSLPTSVKNNAEAWVVLFQSWAKQPAFKVASASEKELEEFVEKSFKATAWDRKVPASDPRVVTLFQVSSALYEYLKIHPETSLTPQIFYWLALIDNRLNNEFFFSLSTIYLKECIVLASHKAMAEKCYKELKANTIFSFTGSRGTSIPGDVQAELQFYEKLAAPPK